MLNAHGLPSRRKVMSNQLSTRENQGIKRTFLLWVLTKFTTTTVELSHAERCAIVQLAKLAVWSVPEKLYTERAAFESE
jgi:hypothetical protein